jgi:RimJ/RimL family protein N-acetyltransferase
MVNVERASVADAPLFATLEQAEDTKEYIIPYSANDHEQKIADPKFVYLRILNSGELVGFFILALDADLVSVEFRRIVVSAKNRGLGQSAIASMEQFCRNELMRDRVWLDVFEDNHRGRHVYEKLEYEKYGESHHEGRKLLLYQKSL